MKVEEPIISDVLNLGVLNFLIMAGFIGENDFVVGGRLDIKSSSAESVSPNASLPLLLILLLLLRPLGNGDLELVGCVLLNILVVSDLRRF